MIRSLFLCLIALALPLAAQVRYEDILEVDPRDLHERVPLIFGSLNEVRLLNHYYDEVHPYQERSQLFGNRGLFRTG